MIYVIWFVVYVIYVCLLCVWLVFVCEIYRILLCVVFVLHVVYIVYTHDICTYVLEVWMVWYMWYVYMVNVVCGMWWIYTGCEISRRVYTIHVQKIHSVCGVCVNLGSIWHVITMCVWNKHTWEIWNVQVLCWVAPLCCLWHMWAICLGMCIISLPVYPQLGKQKDQA